MTNPRIAYQMPSTRKRLSPPDGKPLIVHLVVNVEHWRFEHAMPRKIITAPHGAEQVPDIPNYSWAEYGMRCGLPRILDLFADRGVPASTSINAGVVDAYPECAEAMLEAGWEFIGHGMHQTSMQAEEAEAELIQAVLDKLASFTGQKTRGWLSPGLKESADTPDLLSAAGVDYLCDWVVDDLPIIYAIEKHASPEIYRRMTDTLAAFEKEFDRNPRVMALGLHPHLIGVPHRIGYLERMIDDLLGRDDTIFMTGSKIADWFIAADGGSP
jgi:peptidoglycan/xylan/chitin deacetylase (PgdA/CDA1 family)